MAMTIAEAIIFAAGTVVPQNGTEAAPVTAGVGNVVGPFADYANTFAYRITNSGSAPTSPLTIVFYGVVGTRLYEIDRVFGDVAQNSSFNGTVACRPGFGSYTAKAFGNQTNSVTVEVYLERQVP
jgi:hypothetical protein